MKLTVRVELPASLCLLAAVSQPAEVSLEGPILQRAVLETLEAAYPMLQGTIRGHTSKLRQPFIRFACEQDLSHLSPREPLPAVVAGAKPFPIIDAIAGGL